MRPRMLVQQAGFHPSRVVLKRSPGLYMLACAFVLGLFALLMPVGKAAAQPAPHDPPVSDLRLVGTIEGMAFSGAVFTDTSGKQQFFRLNETMPDGSRIVRLKTESVLLKRPDGMVYEVFVTQELRTAVLSAPAPPQAGRPSDIEEPAPKAPRPPRDKRSARSKHPDEDD